MLTRGKAFRKAHYSTLSVSVIINQEEIVISNNKKNKNKNKEQQEQQEQEQEYRSILDMAVSHNGRDNLFLSSLVSALELLTGGYFWPLCVLIISSSLFG